MKSRNDAIIAFSLANVLFLEVWRAFFVDAGVAYYYKNLPGWIDLAAVTLDVLVLAALLYAGAAAIRRAESTWAFMAARVVFLALFVVGLRSVVPTTDRIGGVLEPLLPQSIWMFDMAADRWFVLVLVPLMLVVAAIVLVFARPVARAGLWAISERRPVRFAAAALMIFSPAGVVLFANAAKLVSGYDGQPGFGALSMPTPAAPSPRKAPGRVVWIVLDEWDRTLSFDLRPPDVALPEIDALRRQSLDATKVETPGMRTLASMPSLISGGHVFDSYPTDASTLMLVFRGRSTHADWRTLPNVFSRARETGAQTAVVGWYHPYSRVLGDTVTRCYWEPTFQLSTLLPNRPTLVEQMQRHALRAVRGVPGLSRLVSDVSIHMAYKRTALESYTNIREASRTVALDPNIDLALFHWPIPHVPGVSIPGTGTTGLALESSYFDNLVLVDRTLGDLRREMEAAGLWDDTTILLSSDHPARLNMWPNEPEWLSARDVELMRTGPELPTTVPFLLKLAGSDEGFVYEEPFSAVLSQALLLAILDGEVTTTEAAVAWLDRHAAESLELRYGRPD